MLCLPTRPPLFPRGALVYCLNGLLMYHLEHFLQVLTAVCFLLTFIFPSYPSCPPQCEPRVRRVQSLSSRDPIPSVTDEPPQLPHFPTFVIPMSCVVSSECPHLPHPPLAPRNFAPVNSVPVATLYALSDTWNGTAECVIPAYTLAMSFRMSSPPLSSV